MIARLAAVVVLLIAPVLALAEPLADHVPAGSIVYLGWRGSADLGPQYPQSNFKAMLDDSQVSDFIDRFLPAVIEKAGAMNPDAGQVGQILSAIGKPTWQHPTAFFLAGVDMPKDGPPMPHLGILWQADADADALAAQLKKLTEQAPLPFPLKVVEQHGVVALLVGYDKPEAALADAMAKPLSADPAYKAAFAHLHVNDAVAAAYVDVQQWFSVAEQAMKQTGDQEITARWPKMRDDLGIGSIKRIAAASGFDGREFGAEAFVDAPGPRSGLLNLVSGKPLSAELMAAIPSTVTLAGASRFDVAGLFDVVLKTVKDADPQNGHEVESFLDGINKQSDVNLRDDLLGALGDEWAYFADPTIGGRGLASFTLVNRLKDPQKFEQSMAKLQEFALKQIQKEAGAELPVSIHFDTLEAEGMTIHYLAVPVISPCWLVHDGNLYVAAFPQVALGAARHFAHKGSSILQNPGFVAIQDHFGQRELSGFSFADLPKTAPDAYGTWLVISRLAGFADLFGIKSPALLLPDLEKLTAHLAPAGSVTWVDDAGFHVRSIEPFPGSTVIASDPTATFVYAQPAMLVSVLLPALSRAREQANRVKSASNLRQIGLGAMLYANDHNGKFPADLGVMIKDEDLTPQVFSNPRSANSAVAPADKGQWPDWVKEHSDYVWLGEGKKTTDVGADAVLAHEKLEDNTEGVNILFGDGHVEWYTMPQAQQLIEKARGVPKAP
jgi:prepilin-type processing-associated H-X9-DG protein